MMATGPRMARAIAGLRAIARAGVWAIALALASCQATRGMPALSASPDALATIAAPPLLGTVELGFLYRIRDVTIAKDVAPGATVSLIDVRDDGSTPTIASSVTTSDGHFVLSFGNGFSPTANHIYYLEAFKGLGSNAIGQNPVRVRTLIRWSNGWTALTSYGITVSINTTAVCVAAGLKSLGKADLGRLFGCLSRSPGSSFDTFTELPGVLSSAEFNSAVAAVGGSIGAGRDPEAAVESNSDPTNPFDVKSSGAGGGAPKLGVTPAYGAGIGDAVTITGLTLADTHQLVEVRFNGLLSPTVTIANDLKSVAAQVPTGASSGPIGVIVRSSPAVFAGVDSYVIYGTVNAALSSIPPGATSAQVTLQQSPSGQSVQQTVNCPCAGTVLSFVHLFPDVNWTVSLDVFQSANPIEHSTSMALAGQADPFTEESGVQAGPLYQVFTGSNQWILGLQPPIAGVSGATNLVVPVPTPTPAPPLPGAQTDLLLGTADPTKQLSGQTGLGTAVAVLTPTPLPGPQTQLSLAGSVNSAALLSGSATGSW